MTASTHVRRGGLARDKLLPRLMCCPAVLLLAIGMALPVAAETASPPTPSGNAASPVPEAKASAAITTPAIATVPAAPALAAAPNSTSGVVEAIRKALADKTFAGKDAVSADVAALAADYATRTAPVWTKDGAYTAKAKAVIAELVKADDWGLEASGFPVPDFASNAAPEIQGAAEARLGLAALKYARFARGGRINPIALSNVFDVKPALEDPKTVLAALANAPEPEAYLRGLHPKHPGFLRLREALLKARGPQVEEKIDPALLVKLPDGKPLKPGAEDDQISLLRQRLKQPAKSADQERRHDDGLLDALKAFQTANGLKPSGILDKQTRKALNAEGLRSKPDDPQVAIDRLVANMERWRWLPTDLGPFYVINNIPEFHSEIWKGSELKLRQKIVVGKPSWPTPLLTDSMEFVIFHPDWGMPPGILAKELRPKLKKAAANAPASGANFFEQLFGVAPAGNAGAGASIIEAQNLNVTRNGKLVDPKTIDWGTANLNQYGFTQPAGPKNPLGMVKFRFPNKHNVYMHDTNAKALFGQSYRALSHGCMRVAEPRRTAEVLLAEDKGWDPAKIDALWKGGGTVTLGRQIPVYLVYFTTKVDGEGRLQTFPDIYGNDRRVMDALRGKAVRYVAKEALDPSEVEQ
jgi:L,D-transpeptidase YcbB